ncbi:MAG: restriction endonuclease subunit S [Succinivibrionaceae bacterium]
MAVMKYMHTFYRKIPNAKISDIIIENPKSTIQVNEAKCTDGKIPFFTSGDTILKFPKPLVSGRNCYLNTGGNADVKFYVGPAAYSTDTWCISARESLSDYLYLLLESIKLELSKKFFQGTGLKHLQKPLLKDRSIYIPNKSELNEFNNSIVPWLTKISNNLRETEELICLRNWLLPMLINGQAIVTD